jgi:hypothetical protein
MGTGNDLARVLGWGSVFDDDTQLGKLLDLFEKATTVMLDRWSILAYAHDDGQKDDEDDDDNEHLNYFDNIEKLIDYELYSLFTHNDDDEALLQSTLNLNELVVKLIDRTGRQDQLPMIKKSLDRLAKTLTNRFVFERNTIASSGNIKNKYPEQVIKHMDSFKVVLTDTFKCLVMKTAVYDEENDEDDDEDDDDDHDGLVSSSNRANQAPSVKSRSLKRNLSDYNDDDNDNAYDFDGDDDVEDDMDDEDMDDQGFVRNVSDSRRVSEASSGNSNRRDSGLSEFQQNRPKNSLNFDLFDVFSVPLASSEDQSRLSTPKNGLFKLPDIKINGSKKSLSMKLIEPGCCEQTSLPASALVKSYLKIPSQFKSIL